MYFVETYYFNEDKQAYCSEGRAYNIKDIDFIETTPIKGKCHKINYSISMLYDETFYCCKIKDKQHYINEETYKRLS